MALEDWKDFVGNSATLTTILQFLSGSQVCLTFVRHKTTGDTSCAPFLVGVVMTFAWLTYGKLLADSSIQTVNLVGLNMQICYCVCYYVYCPHKTRITKQILSVVFFLSFVMVLFYNSSDEEYLTQQIGWLASSLSVAYCGAPLASISHVLKTRSSEALPYYLILGTVLMTAQWSLYGYIIGNSFVTVPNTLGCLIALFQLFLCFYLPSTAKATTA